MGRQTDKLPNDCSEFLAELEDYDDLRDAYARVQARIRAYSAAGRPVPEALRQFERNIMSEFTAQSQGR
jgi:hypothetical protein